MTSFIESFLPVPHPQVRGFCSTCRSQITIYMSTSSMRMRSQEGEWLCLVCVPAKLLQSCLTLCDPIDWSLPGSFVHGILQARILEWVAIPSSRGSSPPRDQILISKFYLQWHMGSLPLVPPGKPDYVLLIFIYSASSTVYWNLIHSQDL